MQTKSPQNLYIQSPKLNQLNLLREVSANARITQAELANRCSLSVAMVNNYMKDLCSNGLIEYNRKSIKSVTYHLTASGSRYLETLQSELIQEMARMFEIAKEHIRNRILDQASTVLQRVVVYGGGDLTRLAFHAMELAGIQVLGICSDDPKIIGSDICGREVVDPSQVRYMAPDAVILADIHEEEAIPGNLASLSQYGIELIRLDTFRKPVRIPSRRSDSEASSFYGGRNQESVSFRETAAGRSLP